MDYKLGVLKAAILIHEIVLKVTFWKVVMTAVTQSNIYQTSLINGFVLNLLLIKPHTSKIVTNHSGVNLHLIFLLRL